jgi:hypothetical protein
MFLVIMIVASIPSTESIVPVVYPMASFVSLHRFVSFQECQWAPDRVPVCWKCTKAIPLKRRQRLTIYHAISAVHADANIHE